MRSTLAVLVFLSLSFGAARVEGAEAPRVGDHVRVTLLAGPPPVTGHLLAYDPEAIGIRLDEPSVGDDQVEARQLPRGSIAGLEVGIKHSHPWRGALIGTLLMATTVLIAWAVSDPQGEASMGFGISLVTSPLIGGGIGAMVGGSIDHERWEPASLPGPVDSSER
jgi:hypothetical protein